MFVEFVRYESVLFLVLSGQDCGDFDWLSDQAAPPRGSAFQPLFASLSNTCGILYTTDPSIVGLSYFKVSVGPLYSIELFSATKIR